MRPRVFALLRWALFSVVAGVALLEVVLHLAGYTYSPLALIRLDERTDLRRPERRAAIRAPRASRSPSSIPSFSGS